MVELTTAQELKAKLENNELTGPIVIKKHRKHEVCSVTVSDKGKGDYGSLVQRTNSATFSNKGDKCGYIDNLKMANALIGGDSIPGLDRVSPGVTPRNGQNCTLRN